MAAGVRLGSYIPKRAVASGCPRAPIYSLQFPGRPTPGPTAFGGDIPAGL